MLTALHIRNFAIIESQELEFDGGFTAITGETGAGKSILVDALGLLLGGRADTGLIRSGCERAELTAEFNVNEDSAAYAWLQHNELHDGQNCLLRRVINDNGRSRAWINGTVVTLAQLQELGESLVEIHGQNEHMRLVRTDELFHLIDGSGTHDAQLKALETAFNAWRDVEQEMRELQAEAPLEAGELDLLRFQIEELENAALTAEAYEQLEAEHRLLARGSDLMLSLENALELMQAEEGSVSSQIQQLLGALTPAASLDRDIGNAAKALEEAGINFEEARGSLQTAVSRMEMSPERLSELDRTIGQLHDLGRKHRTEPGRLLEVMQRLQQRCERADNLEIRKQKLIKARAQQLQLYRQAAKDLHQARAGRAQALSQSVTELMQVLGMEGGQFQLQLEYDDSMKPNRRGDNRIDPLVSANPGMPVGPLRKVASGGELSRISLAVKVASAAGQPAPTQVFDEVDAGIGGDTANAVGRLLQNVAGQGQALCVTHLAQVAVCADHQFQVKKSADKQSTRVETRRLESAERIDEIARMLGGRLSDQSRAHASELLNSALTTH